MRPEGASSGVMSSNSINPPQFLANKMKKKEYKDTARTCIEMMNQFAAADSKFKEHV